LNFVTSINDELNGTLFKLATRVICKDLDIVTMYEIMPMCVSVLYALLTYTFLIVSVMLYYIVDIILTLTGFR
jgi:hypothetical protein